MNMTEEEKGQTSYRQNTEYAKLSFDYVTVVRDKIIVRSSIYSSHKRCVGNWKFQLYPLL